MKGRSFAAKRDANEPEIRDALEAAGWTWSTECPLDLLAAGKTRGGPRTVVLEVKDGGKVPSKQELTPPERGFIKRWRGEVYIVRSIDDALAVVSGAGAHFDRLRDEIRQIQLYG